MKKAIILALAFVLSATTLSACRRGKVNDTTAPSTNDTKATTEHTAPNTTQTPSTDVTIFPDPSLDTTEDSLTTIPSEDTGSSTDSAPTDTGTTTENSNNAARSGRPF